MNKQYSQIVDRVKTTNCCLLRNADSGLSPAMSKMMPYAEIGARLMRLRKSFSDEPQKAWAERHGFSPTQCNNWERGERRIPVESAEKLCDLYGITLDFVYRGRRDGLSENARKAV